MLTKNHETLAAEVARHVEADAVLQGTYWDGSRGCFIGCLAHSDDAAALGEMYGLPLPLVRICENVFESLSADAAKAFFAAIPDAVGRDGKDLTRVHWSFLASELRALPSVDDATQGAINTVIAGMDLLASGGDWPRDDANAAASAARAAAYAASAAAIAAADATRAASHAAYAAAYAARAAACGTADAARAAARAARLRQRDTLLRLIAEA